MNRWSVSLGAFAAALLAVGATAAPAHAQGKPPLVFTAIPDEDETRLVERFTIYAKHFEQKLGVPVKYLPVKSYPAAVTAFTNNQVQFAWFGGLTGVQARLAVKDSDAIAQGAEDVAFMSYFIAHTSAGVAPGKNFPKDIAGKTFTFGARASTSGRLFPEFFIREATGKTPETYFSRVGFSGDHSKTIQLVQSGAPAATPSRSASSRRSTSRSVNSRVARSCLALSSSAGPVPSRLPISRATAAR